MYLLRRKYHYMQWGLLSWKSGYDRSLCCGLGHDLINFGNNLVDKIYNIFFFCPDWIVSLGIGLITFAALETTGIYFGLGKCFVSYVV